LLKDGNDAFDLNWDTYFDAHEANCALLLAHSPAVIKLS